MANMSPAEAGGQPETRRRQGIPESLADLLAGTVRRVLLVLLLVVLLPILLAEVALSVNLFRVWQAQQLQSNLVVARAVAATFEAYVRDVLREEITLGVAIGPPEPLPLSEANELLAIANAQYPAARDLSWLSPQGVILASSNPALVGTDVSRRPDVEAIVGGQDSVLSDLLPAPDDGVPVLVIAQGLRNAQGDLQGIVAATIASDGLDQVLSSERVGAGTIAVLDRQGILVYRRSEVSLPPSARGALATNPLVTRALAGEEATGTYVSPIDGQWRLAGAVPISPFGWAALASVPVAEAIGPVVRSVAVENAIFLVVGIAGVLLALAISRILTDPIDRVSSSAQAIGRGDLQARPHVSRPAELAALAGAITAMAQELQLRQEQREDIVRAVSHDLRNPLAAIQGQTQLLLRQWERSGHNGDERTRAEAILTEVQRMNALIQDLVDSVRSEAGELRLERQPVDLRRFVLDLLQRQATALDTRRIRVQAPEQVPPVSADPDRLERILVNLLSNALKYSEPGSEVTVTIRPQDGEVVTSVTDRGPGIPPEELPRLFQRYYRTEAGRQRREGIGLGLYVTRMLVEAHGGHVWVESALGVGSTFSFSLPVAGTAETSP